MTQNQQFTQELRALADFMDANDLGDIYPEFCLNIHAGTAAGLVEKTRGLGRVGKVARGDYFVLQKSFGDFVRIEWFVMRDQVCERIVTKKIMPAQPEHEIEEISWKCPESLLASLGKPLEPLPTDQRIAEAIADEIRDQMPPRFINCIYDEEIVPTGADDDGGTIPVG